MENFKNIDRLTKLFPTADDRNINVLEALAGLVAMNIWNDVLQGIHFSYYTNSYVVNQAINNETTRDISLVSVLLLIQDTPLKFSEKLPREENEYADALTKR